MKDHQLFHKIRNTVQKKMKENNIIYRNGEFIVADKVIVGDIVVTESGEKFVFAVDDGSEDYYTPYKQISTSTYNIVDSYPAELFEEDVKIGYEMVIGGKVAKIIRQTR